MDDNVIAKGVLNISACQVVGKAWVCNLKVGFQPKHIIVNLKAFPDNVSPNVVPPRVLRMQDFLLGGGGGGGGGIRPVRRITLSRLIRCYL